ncbi:MAG: hypothetical protein E6K51_09940 [Gammaproteobacteria bacterium]|nr:MAG: hypothetical protein E6K51_09940 [Gammaproteobacteria bacterium]
MSEPPFVVQGIDHIVLRVRELPRALAFYRDVLGCRVEREQPELGLFCLALAPFNEPELASWFASRGVGVIDPAARYGAEGQGRSFYIEDPDGNRIEVKGARER